VDADRTVKVFFGGPGLESDAGKLDYLASLVADHVDSEDLERVGNFRKNDVEYRVKGLGLGGYRRF
jgi:hypothetical protein